MISTDYIRNVICLLGILLILSFASDEEFVAFERVYLHFDRPNYVAGDNIWFKAYLVNAQDNRLSPNSSKLLYVELISPESEIVSNHVLRVEDGMAKGDFMLNDSIVAGIYRVRAYTAWMLNYGDEFVFEKNMEVLPQYQGSNMGVKSMERRLRKDKIAEKAKQAAEKAESEDDVVRADDVILHFFPEGGSLVAGIESDVAFKATDGFGKGIDVKGTVISRNGDTISLFSSEHLGMGRFRFTPVEGENYYAIAHSGANRAMVLLPDVLQSGFAMHVSDIDTVFAVNITANEKAFEKFRGDTLLLQLEHRGFVTYERVAIENMRTGMFVTKQLFGPGIMRITLLDALMRPHCERLVYKEPAARVALGIQHETVNDSTAVLRVTATENGRPVKAFLSLSVTGDVQEHSGNIETYMLLESEVRGKIENINSYFDTTNIKRRQQLDLLLMTQGWRDYRWRHIEDSLMNLRFSHKMEKEMYLSGHVRRVFINRPHPHALISMYFPGLPEEEGPIRTSLTDSTGRFELGPVSFHGAQNMIATSKSANNRDAGLISIDPLYLPLYSYKIKPAKRYTVDTVSYISVYEKKKYSLSDTIVLDEVAVKTRDRRGTLSVDKQVEAKDTIWETLSNYIVFQIPSYREVEKEKLEKMRTGIRESDTIATDSFERKRGDIKDIDKVFNDDTQLNFYNVDGKKLKDQDPAKISMKEVNSVKIYKKVIATATTTAITYTVEVIGKHKAFSMYYDNSTNEVLQGYYKARQFYVPVDHNNERGEHQTFHWEPDIELNKNGEAQIIYLVPKHARLRIRAEGLTTDGVPVAGIASR